MTLFVDQFNRVQPFPSKLPKLVSDLVGPGFTLKVDGVVLLGTDKIPTGDVYEVVEVVVEPDPAAEAAVGLLEALGAESADSTLTFGD